MLPYSLENGVQDSEPKGKFKTFTNFEIITSEVELCSKIPNFRQLTHPYSTAKDLIGITNGKGLGYIFLLLTRENVRLYPFYLCRSWLTIQNCSLMVIQDLMSNKANLVIVGSWQPLPI